MTACLKSYDCSVQEEKMWKDKFVLLMLHAEPVKHLVF